jgi:hypothetical protein
LLRNKRSGIQSFAVRMIVTAVEGLSAVGVDFEVVDCMVVRDAEVNKYASVEAGCYEDADGGSRG